MGFDELLKGVQIVAVVCNQWGDTGKGKFSDYFTEHWAEVVARGTGGNNAGHTVKFDGQEIIFHLLPAGIVHDSQGVVSVLGNGMVIDVIALCHELDELESKRMSYKNLMISKDAHVIMPYHIEFDKKKNVSQDKGGIGTTGRGIGPCYADKISRRGVMIGDLFDKEILMRKIRKIKEFYPGQEINEEQIIEKLQPFVEKIKPFVKDTINEMHDFVKKGKKILLEGAQGLLLSVEHGTYPYVTSSDCSLDGTATGVGLSAKQVDLCFGVVKFPFMTRVGAGSFPTEFGGNYSEDYCAKGLEHDIFYEVKEYLGMELNLDEIRKLQEENRIDELEGHSKKIGDYIKSRGEEIVKLMNSSDPFVQGVGIRLAAFEYGATTKRPRRTGWTDAVSAKYAVGINGGNKHFLIFTKVDAVAGLNEFKVCYGYKNTTEVADRFDKREEFLKGIKPLYISYSGYGNLNDVKTFDELPNGLKEAIGDFSNFVGCKVAIVSVGAEREQTIFV